jgi:hypothetical protein
VPALDKFRVSRSAGVHASPADAQSVPANDSGQSRLRVVVALRQSLAFVRAQSRMTDKKDLDIDSFALYMGSLP